MTFSVVDRKRMATALQLAQKGLYSTDPNPRVGCVITEGERVIGQGWHVRAGEGHAEVNALADVKRQGFSAKGATAYVTLEPCSHQGRTPPCAQALIDAGVDRVVAAMKDPNPTVSGNGFAMLEKAGIVVQHGLLEQEAKALNPGFIKRMQTGLPWVRIKMAISLDGRTAMASGESQWITGAAAREDVQRLRARSSAVLTGAGTLIQDNPSLNVRLQAPDQIAAGITIRQPMRVVLCSDGQFPDGALNLFKHMGQVVVCTGEKVQITTMPQGQAQIDHWSLPLNSSGLIDLHALLVRLGEKGCNELLVEAGARLAGAFIQAGLVDEFYIYQAPTLLGSLARPAFDLPLNKMAEQYRLRLMDMRQLGDDVRFVFRQAV
jgi:diaminohydroxyphosphoribosylaminopyrimidine deaminase/5-amino-6-(5-phosphoribosylamino)uracil reductase